MTGFTIWTLVAIGFIAATAVLTWNTSYEQTLQTLGAAARMRAAHVTTVIDLVTQQVEAVAKTDRARTILTGHQQMDDAVWLRERIVYPVLEIEHLTVIAPDGRVWADSWGSGRLERIPPPATWTTTLSQLDFADGERARFAITVPVHTADGTGLLGWIQAHVLLDRLHNDLLEPMGVGPSEETYLVDGLGACPKS